MHHVHLLSNSHDEFYVLVLKQKASLDALLNAAFDGSEHHEKKNGPRCRFIRDNHGDLTIEYFEVEGLETLADVLDYREGVVDNYLANGYVLMDEKHYELLDSPADENFSKILKMVDINSLIKKWGKDTLIQARKKLTVGEFIAHYA
jgi:hypothetical protein